MVAVSNMLSERTHNLLASQRLKEQGILLAQKKAQLGSLLDELADFNFAAEIDAKGNEISVQRELHARDYQQKAAAQDEEERVKFAVEADTNRTRIRLQ